MNEEQVEFNIQGIAIDKTFTSIGELISALGLSKLEKLADSNFEDATSSNIDDGSIFITQLPRGTIITFGDGFDTQDLLLAEALPKGKALRFLIGEADVAFAFEYFLDGQSVRSILHAEGEDLLDEGEPLDVEDVEEDITEIIFNLISDVTGSDFYSLQPDLKSEEYRLA